MTVSIPELEEFTRILKTEGVHQALCYLNARTPHRFTGIYRYDGTMLRNEHLVDKQFPDIRRGDDVRISDAYCEILQEEESLEFVDAKTDGRFPLKSHIPVMSYCGVLIRDKAGQPYGSLCHYDLQRCQPRVSDLPLLKSAVPLIFGL